MAETRLKVQLLERTQDALGLIYAACRQCYSHSFAGDIFDKAAREEDPVKIREFVKNVIASGHESPMEHVKFTFAIEGVSRALTHQLVRHRVASYSQQSQRYVREKDFDYIIPPVFKKDERILSRFVSMMEYIQDGYDDILAMLKEKGSEGEKANQDARFVLPQAAETKIVVTMNCRELKHFFSHRCCARAQWEIRALAAGMLDICRRELPEVFDGLGAKCEENKLCPEGEKFSCGKYPVKKR
ncbi:MAG: FAD-dependent thymidylate synthase [Candidatus Omnitrophica bacterium]|nr:FAD-dependent thymidylate synthase [Candidatus Omnitrophota bacterium]MDD5487779.1 FAD-dependent thymidylate synthase [Candidatus Omnitrophota bacterium]